MPAKETATVPVDGYVIEMAEGDSKNFVEVAKVDGGTCTFDATGLKDGEKYNFRIKAQNQTGTSERSAQLDKPATASALGKRKVNNHLWWTKTWRCKFPVTIYVISFDLLFLIQ